MSGHFPSSKQMLQSLGALWFPSAALLALNNVVGGTDDPCPASRTAHGLSCPETHHRQVCVQTGMLQNYAAPDKPSLLRLLEGVQPMTTGISWEVSRCLSALSCELVNPQDKLSCLWAWSSLLDAVGSRQSNGKCFVSSYRGVSVTCPQRENWYFEKRQLSTFSNLSL